jgi:hypothetical protein
LAINRNIFNTVDAIVSSLTPVTERRMEARNDLVEQERWLAKSVPQFVYRVENPGTADQPIFESGFAGEIQQHYSQ